jgi:uncharacterized membrane protein
LPVNWLLFFAFALFIGTEFLIPDASLWGTISISNPVDTLNPLLIYPGGQNSAAFWSNYPILPWLELVVFGIALGKWIQQDCPKAFKRALYLGIVFLLIFFALRLLDGFGNIRPRAGNSWIDFFNLVKYPPSMTFTLLTTGINLILLYLFDKLNNKSQKLLSPLTIFGRVPLFFYLAHLFLYTALGNWFLPHGTSIAKMYPYWLLGLLILYPLCWWYGRYKQSQPGKSWVHYL